ncbi:MAG TPA: type II secretion system secretin GspD [Stellaceae bacterium]|jgi:general secretion pathway protein D|nr:type II secretion system secretin GspD [Stellaceae bacterium]
MRSVRFWRVLTTVAVAFTLAACEELIGPPGPPAITVAEPAQTPGAPISLGSIDPGRAVAVMASRKSQPALPAYVVRGHEPASGQPAAPHDSRNRGDGAPGDVTLNFSGADIRDVVAEVLGKMLKLNYVIDPDVAGPVTFNVSRPMRRDEVLPVLETVLNSRGATMVQTGSMIRISNLRKEGKPNIAAPMAQAATPGAPANTGPAANAGVEQGQMTGPNTEVFPLRFAGATDMQHILEKALPTGTSIIPDDKQHALMVQGSLAELQLAQDTIRIFDVDQMRGMSMALVPLRNGDPPAVAEELKNIFAVTRKEIDSDAIRFMPVRRLNAVMIISRTNSYMDEARSWIARLDRAHNPNEQGVYVYNLQYGKAVQIAQKLQGLLSGLDIQFKPPAAPATAEGVGSANGNGAAGPSPDANSQAGAKPADAKPSTPADAVPVSALAANAAPDPTGGGQPGVRIEADEVHNALLIAASAKDYDLIRQVLQGIDVPPLQVLIEVTVAEVTLNDQLNYGVEYYISSGNVNTLLTTGASAAAITPTAPGFALSWVTGKFQPRAILDALSDVTETRVISTPRLLVLSNQTARLQVGDVVPIITQSATSTVTANPLVLNNVTYKETGVVLEVTPRVNAGGFVTMDVNQSVSDVVNTTTSTIDSPTIRQRRLTSTISVKSGDSILLGGLIQQNNTRESSGIPVLNDIPGIGALFGNRSHSAGRTELIMLMTPRVISNEDTARETTSKVEHEFSAVLDANTMPRPRRPR